MQVSEQFHINAVAFKESEAWVVQGIEYDIVARCYDVTKLPQAFTRAVLENICITQHLGRRALEGIKPAPAHFKEMYEHAETEMRLTRSGELAPSVDVAVRLSNLAA
jgi:hypothetical protein